ncbi:hypothetical protein GcC1_055035 [Golovinomyces cichoracearum]|uniref:Retrotransposon gag domain-containing protein n=1 Tax=Golovinomyces cichoracearum TaxID=62708 RepID=A0A420IVC6_9PEZI|nr:hypothetical protein GcC1_055035 [Golovinomyces cichoracearum]
MASKTYPTFHICGKYDGSIPVIRWLNKLHGVLRPHYPQVTAEVFFEVISILFVGEAGEAWEWLDFSPKFIEFIDKEKEPNAKDIEEFKHAVTKKFPRKKAENDTGNIQEDIQNLQQDPNESLNSYHERTQELLRRSNGRDDEGYENAQLTIPEKMILSIIIKSFIRAIRDHEVRTINLTKSTILSGSLKGAFERTKKAITTILQREEIERERIEQMELEHFRSQYLKEWCRPLGVSLAMRDQGQNRLLSKIQNFYENERNSWQIRYQSQPGNQCYYFSSKGAQMKIKEYQEGDRYLRSNKIQSEIISYKGCNGVHHRETKEM